MSKVNKNTDDSVVVPVCGLTRGELIAALEGVPDDARIILTLNAGASKYSPLSNVDFDIVYVPDTTWGGMAYSLGDTAEENDMDDNEWRQVSARPRVVLLSAIV